MKNKDTTIIFQEGRLSRVLKVNKKSLKQFFTTLSLLVTALLVSMIITVIFYQSKFEQSKGQESTQIDSLQSQNIEQAALIENLKDENLSLKEKVAQPAENGTELSLFTNSKGFKDLTAKELISLEDTKTEYLEGKSFLKFNIINSKKSGKISGYAFTLLYSESGIQVSPFSKSLEEGLSLEFHQGESFTVSRFRPFEAKFEVGKKLKDISYRVVIFSKTGDLIINRVIGPLNLRNLAP